MVSENAKYPHVQFRFFFFAQSEEKTMASSLDSILTVFIKVDERIWGDYQATFPYYDYLIG